MRLVASCLLIAACAAAAGAKTRVEPDVAYGGHARQRLDLYLPESAHQFATVVFVHGGSLESGDKADADYGAVCRPFVDAGVACANINYRLLQDAPWPAAAADTAAAFAWVKGNIASRGGDPTNVFLVGHSSGARLVATLGTNEEFLRQAGLRLKDVRGVVPMGTILWDEEFEKAMAQLPREQMEARFARYAIYRGFASPDDYLKSWPMKHVQAGMPPFLFIIAEHEKLQPPILAQAEQFIAAARKLGCQASYQILSGARHMDEVRKLGQPDDAALPAILAFIRSH